MIYSNCEQAVHNTTAIKNKETSALVFSILGLLFFYLPVIGLIFALISKNQIKKVKKEVDDSYKSDMLTASKIISTVALVLCLVTIVKWIFSPLLIISRIFSWLCALSNL